MNAYDSDQVQAAIRDAGAWVDTNDTVSDYRPRAEMPPGHAALVERFEQSDPPSHIPCREITGSGPQVVHWFAEWPASAWCSRCALRKMRKLSRARRPCLACETPVRGATAEATMGNLVVHGPLCDRCGMLEAR